MSVLASPWVLVAVIAVAAILATAGIGLAISAAGVWQRQRKLAKELQAVTHADLSVGAQSLLRQAALPSGWTGRIAAMLPQGQDIAYRLQQSGLGWSVGQLVAYSALAGSIALALSLLLPREMMVFGVPLLAGGAACAPYMYMLNARSRRWRKFERQLPDAAGLLGRAIRAGHPVSAGIRMISEELPAPASEEFRQLFEETRFGLPFDDALLSLVDRVPLIDLRLMATAMLIQREVGGNLAEMLERVSETIRERFRLRKQIDVLTAEARMGGVVLMVLPFATAGLIQFVNPTYMLPLVQEHIGRIMIGGMLFMELIGVIWMRRITRVEG